MKPFKYQAGGIIGQWASNENCVIKVLPYYEKDLSEKKYHIQKVREFGLLVRHDCKTCASSPDGIFPLLKKTRMVVLTSYHCVCWRQKHEDQKIPLMH